MKDWIPGEKVTEKDVRDWAEWEIASFDVEKAFEYKEKVKAAPKGKAKPKRMIRARIIVKVIRASAYQHIKAMDNILETVMGVGLETFQVHATDWSNPLRAVLQERVIEIMEGKLISVCNVPLAEVTPLPRTLVLHLDEGSSAFSMTWFLTFASYLRFIAMRDIFHREWNDVRLALGDQKLWWVI